MADRIYDDCYIVMSEYGIQRMTKRGGRLNRGEVSIRVRLNVPSACFTEPSLSASIQIPEELVRRPELVEVEAIAHPEVQND